ncbi:MAG TPA: RsmE family RNA methyltransferase [Acidimicrobiia bacterium]|nr:RsmE family RNA methyltransferase [Acidimicrobiia bacterium]
MRHQPHLYIPGAWSDALIQVPESTRSHLTRVLRLPEGAVVTYGDGKGAIGTGTWRGLAVERGDESIVEELTPHLTIAVAPPRAKDRQRLIVEKLQELRVSRLSWMRTERGQVRPPNADRAASWAIGAFEQSRGSHLIAIEEVALTDLDDGIAASADGAERLVDVATSDRVVVAVGPEGGFSPSELEHFTIHANLGPSILRTDTAAIAAAAVIRC